jgi:hypothetical protein
LSALRRRRRRIDVDGAPELGRSPRRPTPPRSASEPDVRCAISLAHPHYCAGSCPELTPASVCGTIIASACRPLAHRGLNSENPLNPACLARSRACALSERRSSLTDPPHMGCWHEHGDLPPQSPSCAPPPINAGHPLRVHSYLFSRARIASLKKFRHMDRGQPPHFGSAPPILHFRSPAPPSFPKTANSPPKGVYAGGCTPGGGDRTYLMAVQ